MLSSPITLDPDSQRLTKDMHFTNNSRAIQIIQTSGR